MKNLHSQIDIFYNTKNWKNYWTKGLSDFIKGNILDVGSGTGSNIPFYSKVSNTSQITCLEPDKKLFSNLRKKHKNKKKIVIKNLKLSQLKNTKKFKTIINEDVLEHIENDFKELKKQFTTIPKTLKKEAVDGFTYENALRVYLWDQQGDTIPGLAKKDIKELTDFINKDTELKIFADELIKIM